MSSLGPNLNRGTPATWGELKVTNQSSDRKRGGEQCVSACEDLLDGLVQTIRAVWNHQSGSAGNHSVIFIKEMLLQVKREKNPFQNHLSSKVSHW